MREESATTRRLVVAATLILSAGAAAAAPRVDKQDFPEIERGSYLTIVGDCAACHTRPGSGRDFAGGRPIETPFGTIVAPNITPDPQTGIGAFSDDEFINALTKGTSRNGKRLYPAMPYTYYSKVTRGDALAIRAYLNTVPAVHEQVRSNQLPFPLNIRLAMAAWNELFFRPAMFKPRADKSDEWNRGAYLAEGLGHCGMCHTPKNLLGADKAGERLRGYALQGWFAPDITNDARSGVGGWSVEEIVAYLKTGHNRTTGATGPMAETLSLSTSHMRDGDLRAIAVYLKDQPGGERSAPATPDDAVMKVGAKIYADECSGCHTPSGRGVPGMFPSLSGSPVVQQADAMTLMRLVLRGGRSVGTAAAPTAPAMPEFGWLLRDDQVAAVLTYIRNAWGNAAGPVSADDVRKGREALAKRSD